MMHPAADRLARARAASHCRRSAGLSLVEIVVAIAIIAILTAAIAPGIIGVLDRERVESAARTLDELTDAMTEMRADNQDWPGKLSHLAWPITVSDQNICGATYASGKVSQWTGPYLDRPIPATGLPIGIGIVSDQMAREVVSGNDGYLKMAIAGVSLEDAEALDDYVDGDDSSTGGAVRWDALAVTGEGLVTVYYLRPIRGC